MKKTYKLKISNAPKNDKQISTNDRSNSNKKKKTKKNQSSQININDNKQKKGNINNIPKEEKKDNLTLLKEKTAILESNLEKLKLDIDIERNNSIQDSNNLNETIKQINNEINRLNVDNKYLTNNLYSFQKQLDTEVSKTLSKNKKKASKESIEERLNKNIKLKEKMISNNKYSLKLLKKEKQFLENEVKENDSPDKKDNLEKKLEEKKKIQNDLIKEIEELKRLKNEHNKVCAKKISELLKEYDIIKNEYDFESKKIENWTNHKIELENLKKKISKSTKNMKTDNNDKTNNNNNKSNSVENKNSKKKKKIEFKNIYHDYFRQLTEKKKRKENLAIKDYAFIDDNIKSYPQLKSIANTNSNQNESNKSISVNMRLNNSTINSNMNNINTITNKTLFTKSEKNFLSKLIPDNFLDNYENKFNSLINENINIKTKMIDNIKQKKIININNLLKLENSSLQNNIIYKKKILLNSKLSEYNKKKRDIIEKIKENQKYLKYNELIYNKKNNEYNKLVNNYKKIYEDIRNGKLFLKKGAALTPANIQAMDKWGMRGSNNTSFDEINEDMDYANVSEYENEEIEDGNNEEGNNEEENNEEENNEEENESNN